MSDLRFRVYDCHTKELSGPKGLKFSMDDGVIMSISFRFSNYGSWGSAKFPLDQERYKLMQSTGVLDTNGSLIFEGDIVELPHWQPRKWVVDYSTENGAFYFRHRVEQTYDDCHSMRSPEKAKVIGNIYQHAELLD